MKCSGHDFYEANSIRFEMTPLLSNRDENSFFLSKDFNHSHQLFPPVLRSGHDRQDRLADAAVSDTTKRPWYKEHALSTIDSRNHGIIKSMSPEMVHSSVGNSTFNQAQHERRRPSRSPTSRCVETVDISTMPSAIARDHRRKRGWLKARVQHERDQKRRQVHNSDFDNVSVGVETRAVPIAVGPERKQIAFVKEEDLKYSREDRAGTPHSSELQADDDVVTPFSVEELGMGGEAEALAKTWHECNATTVPEH